MYSTQSAENSTTIAWAVEMQLLDCLHCVVGIGIIAKAIALGAGSTTSNLFTNSKLAYNESALGSLDFETLLGHVEVTILSFFETDPTK